MKKNIHLLIMSILMLFSQYIQGQAPTLGRVSKFVLFSTTGAVSNTGISQITGNVGTNSGSNTGFGNVNGVMHSQDTTSAGAATDLLSAYNQLNATIATFALASPIGNGDTLIAGVHSVTGATVLNSTLYLDARGNSNAVFIIKVQGPLSTNANSKIVLLNGAVSCNVYWKIDGLLSMGTGSYMRGTVIVNNAAINMSAGDTIEGRALTTTGAITVNGVMAYIPSGCGSVTLNGPVAPTLGAVACYTLFSSTGPVTNTLITNVFGDIGSNNGLTTGFDTLLVNGKVHPIPDTSTARCSTDLHSVYLYMNALVHDIELLFPAQFGRNLVLTPHTYLMNAAVTFTDTLYLNGMNNPNAVFVIKIFGALSTSTFSKVILTNGTQAKNVYWLVNGAVEINDNSIFRGTIICNNGAINLKNGMLLEGRALTTTGALTTAAITANMPPGCGGGSPIITLEPTIKTVCLGDTVRFIVTATGNALTYQWRRGSTPLVNGLNISGVTNDTLTIFPVNYADTASNYNVIVSGSSAPSDTSINVSLSINAAQITTEPISKTICLGDSIQFIVNTMGTNITYQWRKGNVNLTNIGNISGVNNDTLTIRNISYADTASNYNVIISGLCLINDTSVNAAIAINSTIISAEPSNQNTCSGGNAMFIVKSSGSNLTYQWRRGNVNLTNTGNISGVNNDTLTITNISSLDTASNYNVIVSGTCSPNDTSVNVALSYDSTYITLEPQSINSCSGNTVRFIVKTNGTPTNYQWRRGNVNLTNTGNISGVNNDTLTITNISSLDTASNYNVVVTGTCSSNDTSVNVALSYDSTYITLEPQSINSCSGNTVRFIVKTNGTPTNYQWRRGNVNLTNTGNISGVNNDTLTINSASFADTATNYNVIVFGTCSVNDTSMNVSLNVAPTVIVLEPISQNACVGSNIQLIVRASGSGLTYQWRKGNVNLTNSGNVSGVDNDTLTINPVSITDTASNYNVIVTGACAPADTSANAFIHINPTVITNEPTSVTACIGNNVQFVVKATGTSLTYQWRKGNVNLTNIGNISGANNDTLFINSISIFDTASNYNVIVTGNCISTDTSLNISLNVNIPTISIEPSNAEACLGASTYMAVSVNGTVASYQWRKGNVNLSDGANLSGTNTDTLRFINLSFADTTSDYNVIVTGPCGLSDTSNNVSLKANVIPVITAGSNSPVCVGKDIELNAQTFAGGIYSWSGPSGFSSNNQNPIRTNTVLANAGDYSVTVMVNGCQSLASIVSVVVINCYADLEISKSVNNNKPIIGHQVIFTITLKNNGPFEATDVRVTDQLQSGYTYVSSSATKGTYDANTGIWSIDTLANGGSAVLSITAKVNETGNYSNTASVDANQTDTLLSNNTAVTETIPTDFFIPGGFSPNGDGINDVFVIRGIQSYPGNRFTVFNRWGSKVFDQSDYQNNWDGKSGFGVIVGGEILPVGTYFYILDLNNDSEVLKGTIYLNK